ncbi:MAG: hypothetical protein J5759_04265 [Bacteroidales bacterium]|nr:hypothetical protein [Bacteroidales bacterium]
MRKYISAFALAALVIAGCTTEKEFAPVQGTEISITASRDGGTRTVIQQDGTTLWWSAAEEINVFYGNESAVFTGQNDAPAASAVFKGTLDVVPDGNTDIYAVYPSSSVNAVDGGVITLEVPITQQAIAGTFADGVFPAVAVSKTTTMSFQNVAGGIKFSVSEPDVTEVVIEANGDEPIAGVVTVVFEEGIPLVSGSFTPSSSVTVVAPQGGFDPAEFYYAALLPAELGGGLTFTLKRGDKEPVTIASKKAQTVKRGVIGKVGALVSPAKTTVERVWGLYSNTSASWNEYYGGTPNTDRNVAMDDEYIYIAETRGDAAKLWAISIADPTVVKPVNVEGVEGGFWQLACPRVVNDADGNPNLFCCNMNSTGESGTDPRLYWWKDGIDAPPTGYTLNCSKPYERIGDTFTFWGTVDKGMLLMASTTGNIRMWKFKDKVLSNGTWVDSRYVTDPKVNGVSAYYPFPDDKNHGIYCVRDEVQAYSAAIESGKDAWTAPGGTLLNVSPLGSNYFLNVACFHFIEFGDKRFIAYTRNVDGADGRIMITQGEEKEPWMDIVARRHSGELLYQAALQNASEIGAIDEAGNGKASGNSGMDIAWRVIGGELYIACVKQNVGLSLFKLTIK